MAKVIRIQGARPADEGESLVVHHLESVLPSTYTLLPNIELAQPGSPPFEYDIVVISPHALYVIEVKRWRGGIRGDDSMWLVAGRYNRPNPLLTTNNKARVLKSLIKRLLPAAAGSIWVEAVVAIADDQGTLEIRGQSRDRILRYTDLFTFLTDRSALNGRDADIRSYRGSLEVDLQRVARPRSVAPLRYGDYEVKETLLRRDDVAEFLAINTLLRDPQPVRLRVFAYNPYLPSEERELRRAAILRDADAMAQIGTHPNLLAIKSVQSDPLDPDLLIEVTDWSDEGTLRDLMNGEAPLALERKLALLEGIALGLQAAHEAGVIHRDIRPENILIGRDGQPRIMNFDRARLASTGAVTIGNLPRDPLMPQAYIAPELVTGQRISPATDIYGLGVLLYELVAGNTPFNSPEDAVRLKTAGGGPSEYGATSTPQALGDLARRMVHAEPSQRSQTAREVADTLSTLRQKPSGTHDNSGVEQSYSAQPNIEISEAGEPTVFSINDLIDGKYSVLKILNAGGSGQAYKVYDSIFDRAFALKVFKLSDLSPDWLKREVQTLSRISHPNIVQVQTWGRLPRTGRLYLVSEFIEGEELTQFITPAKRLPIGEAVGIIIDLLDALEALHPKIDQIAELERQARSGEISQEDYAELGRLKQEGILHRDIKPSNLMLAKDGVKLLDFNIAKPASEVGSTYVGTLGYMLPTVGIEHWQTDSDLFATGIVLYQLVTGHHPYEDMPDRILSTDSIPYDPLKFMPELTNSFSEILMRATSVQPQTRYSSARRLREDLERLNEIYVRALPNTTAQLKLNLEQWEIFKTNYNPFVTRLLRLYSQARRDNSGTRGLDEIAQLTYVQTRLDRFLGPALLEARYRLVIVTGNAGDGKTAFIKNLEHEVIARGIKPKQLTLNSSSFTLNGAEFLTNYDGSQDEGDLRANDQVLSEFFAPFDDTKLESLASSAMKPFTRLIAINEGRLIDYFNEVVFRNKRGLSNQTSTPSFRKLGQLITDFFGTESPPALPDWMLIVDLNRRSVVAPDPESENQSIFERQLSALLNPELWAPCNSCVLKVKCFIKFNVDTLSDPAAGAEVRERLRVLFEVTHLRRQLHITMRDLRSALSWLIFRDHNCDDIAQILKKELIPEPSLRLLYANAFASDEEQTAGHIDDRLVRLLREIDPAEVSNPTIDRPLHFRSLDSLRRASFEKRSIEPLAILEQWDVPIGYAARQPDIARAHRAKHGILRRLAFFERRDEGWRSMLPYRKIDIFHNSIAPNANHEQLRQLIVRAISYAEGARNQKLMKGFLCLRASSTTATQVPVKSFRLFPITDFKIEVRGAQSERESRFIERMPDRILFYHAPSDPQLRAPNSTRAELIVSLDLLELLAQVEAGFRPSPDDVSGFFINLIVFKNALARLPYRRALLTRDDQTYYELSQTDTTTLALQPWEAA